MVDQRDAVLTFGVMVACASARYGLFDLARLYGWRHYHTCGGGNRWRRFRMINGGTEMSLKNIIGIIPAAIFAAMLVTPTMAQEPHEKSLAHPICVMTTISKLGARLVDADPEVAGSSVEYANGEYGISYDYVPEFSRDSRIGDPIRLSREK